MNSDDGLYEISLNSPIYRTGEGWGQDWVHWDPNLTAQHYTGLLCLLVPNAPALYI